MKRVGSWKILAKYGVNSYKVELPSNLYTYHIFNVQDLVELKGTLLHSSPGTHDDIEPILAPIVSQFEVDNVFDSRVKTSTMHKLYKEHLFKWKGKPTLEATWVTKTEFKKVDIPLDMLPLGVN